MSNPGGSFTDDFVNYVKSIRNNFKIFQINEIWPETKLNHEFQINRTKSEHLAAVDVLGIGILHVKLTVGIVHSPHFQNSKFLKFSN